MPAPPAPKPAGTPGTSISKGPATSAAAAQARPTAIQRPTAVSAAPSIKTIDKVLIYTATVAALAGVGLNFYVFFFVLKPLIETFQP